MCGLSAIRSAVLVLLVTACSAEVGALHGVPSSLVPRQLAARQDLQGHYNHVMQIMDCSRSSAACVHTTFSNA